MSREYDLYLEQHRNNVGKGFRWLEDNLPEILIHGGDNYDLEHQIVFAHDMSKNSPEEYDAYDIYFYGGNRSYEVVQNFNYSWLHHIHNNPHHWQHWVLINDDKELGSVALDMPYNYIIEMICDWWAFSWQKENLFEIFDWYDEHSKYMMLGDKTKKIVEDILKKIREKLKQLEATNE